jgi:porphobilinogen deaminase
VKNGSAPLQAATIRIGTRRSPLALAQAEETRGRLAAAGVDADIVPMS